MFAISILVGLQMRKNFLVYSSYIFCSIPVLLSHSNALSQNFPSRCTFNNGLQSTQLTEGQKSKEK